MQSWQSQLRNRLHKLQKEKADFKIAVLGIGNELNGDDAAGVLVARSLLGCSGSNQRVTVFDAGQVPENFSGNLRRLQPDFVLLVDAGNFGGALGEVRLFDWGSAEGMDISTHSLPLSVFASFLTAEIGCTAALLLIQPGSVDFLEPVSPRVLQAVGEVSGELAGLLSDGLTGALPVHAD